MRYSRILRASRKIGLKESRTRRLNEDDNNINVGKLIDDLIERTLPNAKRIANDVYANEGGDLKRILRETMRDLILDILERAVNDRRVILGHIDKFLDNATVKDIGKELGLTESYLREETEDEFDDALYDELNIQIKSILNNGFTKGDGQQYADAVARGAKTFAKSFEKFWHRVAEDLMDAMDVSGDIHDAYQFALDSALSDNGVIDLNDLYEKGIKKDAVKESRLPSRRLR